MGQIAEKILCLLEVFAIHHWFHQSIHGGSGTTDTHVHFGIYDILEVWGQYLGSFGGISLYWYFIMGKFQPTALE